MDKAKTGFSVYLSYDNNFRKIPVDQTVEKVITNI